MTCIVCGVLFTDRHDLEAHLRLRHGIQKGEGEIDAVTVCPCGQVHYRPTGAVTGSQGFSVKDSA